MPTGSQPTAAPPATMAQRRAGSAGIDRREMPIATYYRALSLAPRPPPVPVAVVGDSARRSPSPPDVEDPPLDLPEANPARGGAPTPPPAAHVPPPFLQGRLDLVRRQSAPLEEDAGRSRRRRQANSDEGSSERRDAPAPPEEIYEALRAIPGLARDDLLRAYSKLLRDDRQFRSLMALPRDMRKGWLLMELRNSQ